MAARTSPDSALIGRAVLVQIPGNLVEVAADPAVLGCASFPTAESSSSLTADTWSNGAYGGAPDRLPEKFGLADTIGRKPRCEVGVFIFGQPGFHNAAAVGRVVFASAWAVNLLSLITKNRLVCSVFPGQFSQKTACRTDNLFAAQAAIAGFGEGTPQQVFPRGAKTAELRILAPW